MKVVQIQSKDAIRNAIDVLRAGGVVAAPTDTVYGLLADATNREAVSKVFEIKGRGKEKALPIFVASIAIAKEYARINEAQEQFLRNVWPGKTTVVLESTDNLPEETGTKNTIGLRIPNYELIAALLREFQKPLTGTSANVSGRPSAVSGKEVVAQFENVDVQPELVIDGGALPFSRPSRIIDITGKEPKIIRE